MNTINQLEHRPLHILNGENDLRAVVSEQVNSLGMDDPEGVTAIGVGGFSEPGEMWGPLARTLVTLAGSKAVNLTVVRYTDEQSYTQNEHDASALSVVRGVRSLVPPTHEVYLLGHSRGGITTARIASRGLVAENAIQGVIAMASPVKGVRPSPVDLALEAFATPRHALSAEARVVYRSFGDHLLRHAGIDIAAISQRYNCPRELLKAIGGRTLSVMYEAFEVSTSDVADDFADLEEQTRVVMMYGDRDCLAPWRTNKQHLERAGYKGRVIRLRGQTHCSMMSNMSAATHIMSAMQPSSLAFAA